MYTINTKIKNIIAAFLICFFIGFSASAQFSTKLPLSEFKVNCPSNFFGTWTISDNNNDEEKKMFNDYVIIRKNGERGFTMQVFKYNKSTDYNNYNASVYEGFFIKINDTYFLQCKKLSEPESDEEEVESKPEDEEYTIQRIDLKEDNFIIKDVIAYYKEISTTKELESFFKKNINNSFFYSNSTYGDFAEKIMYKQL
jgi:hypothetical protein